jgi:septum formation protein
MNLVLASTSQYRRALLDRIGVPFSVRSPGVDEAAEPHESPQALVARLAAQKAAGGHIGAADELIIGSDQVAVLEGRVLGKPGNAAANCEQLSAASGKTVAFFTGVSVLNTASGRATTQVVPFAVRFRSLTRAQVEAYVRKEPAYDCAGGFKCEGLGIALFESMDGADPTALVGLPMIALCRMLRAHGIEPLA